MKQNRPFYGAAYYAEYMPYDRIDIDMEMMEQAAMDVKRIAEATWSWLIYTSDAADDRSSDLPLETREIKKNSE